MFVLKMLPFALFTIEKSHFKEHSSSWSQEKLKQELQKTLLHTELTHRMLCLQALHSLQSRVDGVLAQRKRKDRRRVFALVGAVEVADVFPSERALLSW